MATSQPPEQPRQLVLDLGEESRPQSRGPEDLGEGQILPGLPRPGVQAREAFYLARDVAAVWGAWAKRTPAAVGWVGKLAKAGLWAGTVATVADIAAQVQTARTTSEPEERRRAYVHLAANITLTAGTYLGGWWGRGAFVAAVAAKHFVFPTPATAKEPAD